MKTDNKIESIHLWSIIFILITIALAAAFLNISTKPRGGLYEAIKVCDVEKAKKIIYENRDLVNKEIGSFTPLNYSIRFGCFEITNLLVVNGADLNSVNGRHGDPVLSLPAIKGDIKTIKLLLKHGANIDAKNMFLETPLMKAAQYCQEEAIKTLITNGANKHAKSDKVTGYKTAEDFAIEKKCPKEILTMLRDPGGKIGEPCGTSINK